jgi:hypothetical protein
MSPYFHTRPAPLTRISKVERLIRPEALSGYSNSEVRAERLVLIPLVKLSWHSQKRIPPRSDRPGTGLVLEAITCAVRGVTGLSKARISVSFASRSFIALTYDSWHVYPQHHRAADTDRLMPMLSHTQYIANLLDACLARQSFCSAWSKEERTLNIFRTNTSWP